jgi:hypothetical protein
MATNPTTREAQALGAAAARLVTNAAEAAHGDIRAVASVITAVTAKALVEAVGPDRAAALLRRLADQAEAGRHA